MCLFDLKWISRAMYADLQLNKTQSQHIFGNSCRIHHLVNLCFTPDNNTRGSTCMHNTTIVVVCSLVAKTFVVQYMLTGNIQLWNVRRHIRSTKEWKIVASCAIAHLAKKSNVRLALHEQSLLEITHGASGGQYNTTRVNIHFAEQLCIHNNTGPTTTHKYLTNNCVSKQYFVAAITL